MLITKAEGDRGGGEAGYVRVRKQKYYRIADRSRGTMRSSWGGLAPLIPLESAAIASVHINMGESALFWSDAWFIGGSSRPLCWRLPWFFSFVNNGKVSVHEFLISQDIFSMFFLPLSHQAALELQVLEGWILDLNRDPTIPDVWTWPGKSGCYTAKSFTGLCTLICPQFYHVNGCGISSAP